MEAPFIYGKIATDENFTDREEETATLVSHFTSLVNAVIISPRRWGKRSLVHKAAKLAMEQDSRLRICFVNLFNVRSEEEFYTALAQDVISGTSAKREEAVETARRFFSRLIPKITVSADSSSSVSLEFNWEEVRRDPDEILELPERIAADKGLKVVVCIGEFQTIADFTDPLPFQKRLRSHWQLHRNVSYCICGSRRNMMTELFNSPSMPFYKFGDLVYLRKIDKERLAGFIKKRFEDTGKSIDDGAAALIVSLVESHPYYAQQLAQGAWFRTEGECSEEIVREALDALTAQLSMIFQKVTDTMTVQQIRYIQALLAGEKSLCSTDVLYRYRISSVTSAARSKMTLLKNDVLDDSGNALAFQDPVYAHWLKDVYFKKQV